MKKHLILFSSLALGLAACSDAVLDNEGDIQEIAPDQSVVSSQLRHVNLSAFSGNQDRVVSGISTRVEGDEETGRLVLVATIENPSSSQEGVRGFVREEGGRYLSATCVYYDEKSEKYYATYHLQGNNYNTQLKNGDVAGFIETFTIDDEGNVNMEAIYRPEDPSREDFDFNHLYFDNVEQHADQRTSVTEDRIIAVGHRWTPGQGKGDTQAIIAKVNFDGEPSLDYKIVYTNDKILDADGKSLGRVDAQDVNCVVRRYDTYYLATRRGISLLNATNDSLFAPRKDYVGNDYFIKSEGSVKHVAVDGGYSKVTFLYLKEDFPQGFTYDTPIDARMVKVDIVNNGLTGRANFGYGSTLDTYLTDVSDKNIFDLDNYHQWPSFNIDFDREVAPIDGKNVLFMPSVGESQFYAALGKAGLYFRNNNTGQFGKENTGWLEFGNRPVNGVFADDGYGSEHTHGFIYVCNGSKLTIFNRYKLDEVASYNLPEGETGSANYVTVRRADELNEFGTYDRIITVAYGQAGLKVFRFSPVNIY